MTLEYDGSAFVGWQRQPHGLSVQEAVEEALSRHLGEKITVRASGRTDAGVHALGQVISFRTASAMPLQGIHFGTQANLPRAVAITEARDVHEEFDPRGDARLRWYRFFLLNREVRPAIGANYLTHVRGELDLDLMRQAADVLTGEHDFCAFRASSCEATRTRLTLHRPEITVGDDGLLILDFRCRSFLQNMVRILAGSMVACAKRRMSPEELAEMVDSGRRHTEARTLPPHGLFLYRVFYEEGEVPTMNCEL